MEHKLFRLAFISSPILAIYGVAPIYIFQHLFYPLMLGAFFFLTFIIFVFWLINIRLTHFAKEPFKRYALSYIFTTLLHFSMTILAPRFPLQGDTIIFVAYPIISILAINSIILIIINSILLEYEKKIIESEIKNLKLSNLEAQKQVLLQQLQPHFLFNALSTLKSLISENPEEGESYVVKLSEFLRYSVQAHTKEVVFLSEELRFTQDYIDLQKMRFGEALHCEVAIPDEIFSKKIPVYALQTLVENAIKHNNFTEKKPLLISIGWEDNRLKVSNNKQAKQLVNLSGTGLTNLNRRYQIVANKDVEIINQENEFVVFIHLL